jgi:hypothetical protein
MRAEEFLIERWTRRTVDDYFDNKKQPKPSRRDFSISCPQEGCVLLKFKTIPDLTKSFFRMAEYYEGHRYIAKKQHVDMAEFLDNWIDRQGNVDYFKFWDGFNITDSAFRAWSRTVGTLSQAEQTVVDAINRATAGMKKFCVIGISGDDPATLQHEMFHAKYYLNSKFKTNANQLLKDHAQDHAVKTIKKILTTKLDYTDHVEEEVGAYLYAGSQLKLVFGIEAQDLVKLFQALDNK